MDAPFFLPFKAPENYLESQVKTAVVGVPCGIEGSMINEFVEALETQFSQNQRVNPSPVDFEKQERTKVFGL